MEVSVNIENIKNSVECNFGRKCLEGFDSSLCCEIIRDGEDCLFTIPVSTFKSSNCVYAGKLEQDNREINICTCPIRIAIYKKYNI